MLRGPSSIRKLITFFAGEKRAMWLLFEPRDLWFGVFWKVDCTHGHVYVCLLPMFPILFTWVRKRRPSPWL